MSRFIAILIAFLPGAVAAGSQASPARRPTKPSRRKPGAGRPADRRPWARCRAFDDRADPAGNHEAGGRQQDARFHPIDYLNFDRVEGRWKYVSMDTRFPVGILPARSFGPAVDGKTDARFELRGFVGFGPQVEGRFMIFDMAISSPDADHMLKEQHVMMANGTGRSWLFVRYEYTRRH